jgi:hypothetical protein
LSQKEALQSLVRQRVPNQNYTNKPDPSIIHEKAGGVSKSQHQHYAVSALSNHYETRATDQIRNQHSGFGQLINEQSRLELNNSNIEGIEAVKHFNVSITESKLRFNYFYNFQRLNRASMRQQ